MATPTTGQSKIKVILFERDPNTTMIIKNALDERLFILDPVRNVFSGINMIKETQPDIVIANAEFPEMSGLELLGKVEELSLNIPCILYGPKDDDFILNAFRSGVVDYWPKPLIGKDMKKSIARIRQRREKAFTVNADKISSEEIKKARAAIDHEKKELQHLLQIASSLNFSGDTKISLKKLTDLAAEIMGCESASIMLINEREKVLELVVASGDKGHSLETIKISMGEGIAGWVAANRKPLIVNDTKSDTRFSGKVNEELGYDTHQILAVPMELENETIGVAEVINTKDNRDFEDNDLRIMMDMSKRIATVIAATRKIEDQQNFYSQTTNILVNAIEKKDVYTEAHSWKVAEYSHKIAFAMDFSDNEKNDIHFASLLHDIGKLALPSYLFNKRVLSDRERDIVRQHSVQGAKLLEPIILWKPIVPLVLYHHEAWDGSGYPAGLVGDKIPLGARIINLTEAFSVMRSPNSYKKQMNLKETILEIMRCSGKQFDPDVVKVFIKILEKENAPR